MSTKSDHTRRRIVEAAVALFEQDPTSTVSMGAIAREAGVSRQAVYLHFQSRAQLMLAMVELTDDERGLHELLREVHAATTPREALFASVRVTARYAPRIDQIAMALERNRHLDPDLDEAFRDRIRKRRRGLLQLTEALAAGGELSAHWTPAQAADLLLQAGLPRNFHELVSERGWSVDDFERWLTHLAESLLVTPGDRS